MSTNTKILLPYYTQTEKVFQVMEKITGTQYYQDSFERDFGHPKKNPNREKEKFDPNLPAGGNNRWHLSKKPNDNILKVADDKVDMFHMQVKDVAGNIFYTYYYTEMEDEGVEIGSKYMLPNAGATWVTIGKRLVDFFGGKMLFEDSRDEEDIKNWYVNKKAKYGKREKDVSNNDRYYQYQNALFNEPLLTSSELTWASQFANMYERDKKLHAHLIYLETYQHFDNLMESKEETAKKPKI